MKLVILIIAIGLAGCDMSEDPLAKEWQEVQIRNIKKCEQAGGLPIKSVWDNRMTECQMIKP